MQTTYNFPKQFIPWIKLVKVEVIINIFIRMMSHEKLEINDNFSNFVPFMH